MFDKEKVREELIIWIRNWFKKNGNGCKAVVGISGGKDSSVVAALCVKALGKENVYGVLMPNKEQADIDIAKDLVKYLDIKYSVINIKDAYEGIINQLKESEIEISMQTIINLPPRIRMSTLYAVSQSVGGRVANTCNLSEDFVGYATRYGDSVGDFSPLSNLTVTEVKELGRSLNLPDKFVNKVPIDGLCGKTDEENLGFTYEVLDKYIRTNICVDEDVKNKIDTMNENSKFKLELMDKFEY